MSGRLLLLLRHHLEKEVGWRERSMTNLIPLPSIFEASIWRWSRQGIGITTSTGRAVTATGDMPTTGQEDPDGCGKWSRAASEARAVGTNVSHDGSAGGRRGDCQARCGVVPRADGSVNVELQYVSRSGESRVHPNWRAAGTAHRRQVLNQHPGARQGPLDNTSQLFY